MNGMRIKSFFAASVDSALAEARRELGPEALLVQSRTAPPEARVLGDYEVVCALLPSSQPSEDCSELDQENLQPTASDLDAESGSVRELLDSDHPFQAAPAETRNV